MDIGAGDEGVGDEIVTTVDATVIQVKETGRLAVPDHKTALGIGGADLDPFSRNVLLLDRQRLLDSSSRSVLMAASSSV